MEPAPDASPPPPKPSGSGWAPLRSPSFRRLWSAQFVSNVGSWMQTVTAQWAMVSLTSSAVLVSAIGAAGSLPVLLLGIPAGALGDLVDRRKLIVITQLVMLVAAASLAVLAALSGLTPAVILALLFVLGCGGAASAPTWQTLQPELVDPADRQQAIALGSVNQNLARAIGPALGGVLLAATSAAIVFGVNAISFVAVVLAVAATALPKRPTALPREHAIDAVRAGGRYVAFSPTLIALIVRALVFIFPASAIWALLPLVARAKLGLGATGYGLLLGCVGLGAFAAASLAPVARRRLGPKLLYASAAAVIGGGTLVLALSHSPYLDAVALVLAGSAWISGLGLLGAAYQSEMPSWVKARGMSYYLIAFQGSSAIGALAFGAIAQAAGLSAALIAVSACLGAAALATFRLALPAAPPTDVNPGEPWPLPEVDDADVRSGPVMVNVVWPLREQEEAAFMAASRQLRALRRRTGATRWRLYRNASDPSVLVESFVLGSWAEHELQHARVSGRDEDLLARLEQMLKPGHRRNVHHYLAAR